MHLSKKKILLFIYHLEFWKEIPGYGVKKNIHHLDVKIKCKVEWRKDTQVALGPRGRYKGPKDKCSIGGNPPITALTSPCGDVSYSYSD